MSEENNSIEPVEEDIKTEEPKVEEIKPAEPKKTFGVLNQRLNSILQTGAVQQQQKIAEENKPVVDEPKPDDELPGADEQPTGGHKKPIRLEERSVPDLVDEVKKWMSIAEKRKVAVETGEPNQKLASFVDGLKTDFYKTYESHHEEFGLPDIDYLKNQITNISDKESRIEQWQNTELIPHIERKFKLEPGTFVNDPADLYKKGTPTEMFRRETSNKEKELDEQFGKQEQLKIQTVQRITEQQQKDVEFLKKNYYIGSEENFDKAMEDFNTIAERLSKGELSEDKNPFAIRNIFRGVYFDELAEALVKKAEDNLHKQYNGLGLFLPHSDKGTPTDVTNVKGTSPIQKVIPNNKYSQQQRIFNRFSN